MPPPICANLNKESTMQRSLIALAVLATLGTSAFAQSSTVTLYGRANVTIERQKSGNGPNNWVMQNNASRFGLKGSEDLGGGMKAGFQIEHGFNINNGTQSQSAFWARQSEVNLSGNWGMVRLGNFTSEAYYATSDYIGMHNHETGTSSDAFYADLRGFSGASKVAYRTPAFSGATVEFAINEGGQLERTFEIAANYDAGPLHLGFGYQDKAPNNKNANQYALRGLYEMGAITLGATIQRDKDGLGVGFGNRTNYRLAGMYTMGATELHLNYGRAGDYNKLAGNQKANQYTLGLNQNLSKRTKVYTFFTKIADSGSLYGDFQSFAVGVRHNF
jgi:predicted porin